MLNKIITCVSEAATYLKTGHVVAFPTETVYGLGANANNKEAIQKVFAAKDRPSDHPLIVHIAHVDELSSWARDIHDSALLLADHFWPGPLTLILNKQFNVSPLITGGQDTIALRIPNHPIALDLLRQVGTGIVGPSANKYGRVSPTSASHVAADFGDEVKAILDGGNCNVGIESTILDLTGTNPVIRRLGAISSAQISAVLGCEVKTNCKQNSRIRTPGNHAVHYAPRTPAMLVNTADLLLRAATTANCTVISFQARPLSFTLNCNWQQVSSNPIQYAHDLYALLRAHDSLHLEQILIEMPPQNNEWIAILDRLMRATSSNAIQMSCYEAV